MKIEFKDTGGGANAKLFWKKPGGDEELVAKEHFRTRTDGAGALAGATPATTPPTTSPATTPPGEWTGKYLAGLRGTYYLAKEIGPNVPSVERIDPNIDFGWGRCARISD